MFLVGVKHSNNFGTADGKCSPDQLQFLIQTHLFAAVLED